MSDALSWKNSLHQFLLLPALIVLVISAQPVPRHNAAFSSLLPDSLGEYSRSNVSPAPISATSRYRDLLNEYGLKAVEQAVYVNAAGRRMRAEAFRFGDSE